MTNEPIRIDEVSRRDVLKAGTMAAGTLVLTGPATADDTKDDTAGGGTDGDDTAGDGVDEPEGFDVEMLAGHSPFSDDVAASFRIEYDGGDAAPIESNLSDDASCVVVARVTWGPEGTSGWHTHPGPVIVTVAEGELELVNERDCVIRTYAAGEAFIDPGQGNVHVASNPSGTDEAVAYATFLGVPDGDPATVWVEPPDC